MSIIGPRPLLVSYLPWYTEEEKQRHDVRPGLSGLAQVNGRNSVTWEEKFSWDLKYVDRISFDYAIFIGGKDDYVRRESDRTHKYAARDNVYLEFGLYAGILTYLSIVILKWI